MLVSSVRWDTLGALADHIVSEQQLTEKECTMRAETAVIDYQATLRDTNPGISLLIEDALTALVTPEGHKGVKRADIRVKAMLQGLVEETLDERLN